ncbi:hypothetical protein QBZ16_005449 [Prototheca wickerhamii]|uniref:Uncharacterized protein n=1 Tax=Prototheca wickerhamii TaxID=3111 RepID=A0AAD9IGG4_PROWI|nr:hypothetical protein QBZ16_005449 [Prototheca wickerhamii]
MADSVYSSPFSGGRACSSQGSPELDRLRHENTELLEKLTTAHNSLSALEQNRAELQTRATVGQEMSHATNKVLRELTERLSQEAMEKASLEATLLEREMELRAVRESVHASETNFQQEANEEVFRAQERLAEALASLTGAQEREAALRLELDVLRDRLEASGVTQQALLLAADGQARDTAAELARVLQELDAAEREREALRREGETERERWLEREAEAKAAATRLELESAARVDELRAEVARLEGVARDSAAQVEALSAQLAGAAQAAAAERGALTAQLEETAREAEAALEELQAEATAELEALQAKLEGAEDTGSKLLRQLAAATAAKETGAVQLAKATAELETLRPRALDLAAQVERLAAAAREHEAQMSGVLAELQEARSEAARARRARGGDGRAPRERDALRAGRRELERLEAEAREEAAARKRAEAAHATGLLEIIELAAARDAGAQEAAGLRARLGDAERRARGRGGAGARLGAKGGPRAGASPPAGAHEPHARRGRRTVLSAAGSSESEDSDDSDDAASAPCLRDKVSAALHQAAGPSRTQSGDFSIGAVRPGGQGLGHRLPPLPLSARLHVRNKLVLSGLPGKQGLDQERVASDDEADDDDSGRGSDGSGLTGRQHRRAAGLPGHNLVHTGLKVAVSLGMAALGAALTLHGGSHERAGERDRAKGRAAAGFQRRGAVTIRA